MSKRLQVLLPDAEMEAVQRLAKAENISVGELVRRALRDAEHQRPTKSATAKLAAIRTAVQFAYPTADIDEMNREIQQGYRS
jgi:hypothetical protein